MGFKRRRSGPEARDRILDAAEEMTATRGPDGLRLAELARSLGMSHPAILHHFGSRAGLVRAVVERSVSRLEKQLLDRLAQGVGEGEGGAVLEMLWSGLSGDNARIMAWLMLSADDDQDPLGYGAHARRIAEAVHAIRRQRGIDAPLGDTLNVVLLAGLAMFGEAVAGRALRNSAGLGPESREPFVEWLAGVLRAHLDASA